VETKMLEMLFHSMNLSDLSYA